jgi:hypothetical protein
MFQNSWEDEQVKMDDYRLWVDALKFLPAFKTQSGSERNLSCQILLLKNSFGVPGNRTDNTNVHNITDGV